MHFTYFRRDWAGSFYERLWFLTELFLTAAPRNTLRDLFTRSQHSTRGSLRPLRSRTCGPRAAASPILSCPPFFLRYLFPRSARSNSHFFLPFLFPQQRDHANGQMSLGPLEARWHCKVKCCFALFLPHTHTRDSANSRASLVINT